MLDIGHDFYCALFGVWVAKSEFNSDEAAYHEPKNGTPYVAAGLGACKCLTCARTDKIRCKKCDMPKKLAAEQEEKEQRARAAFDKHGNFVGAPNDIHLENRCTKCMAQYKMNGKLR